MKGPRKSKPKSAKPPLILLTGRRDNRRHLVEVCGHAAWLTFGEFTTLHSLVYALLTNAAGTCPLDGMAVLRLRRAFNRAGKGLGKKLIHPASDGEYFLAIAPNEIDVASSFRELGPRHFGAVTKEMILRELDRIHGRPTPDN